MGFRRKEQTKENREQRAPGVDTILKGSTMPSAQQWDLLAKVLAIRNILIKNNLTTKEEFDNNTKEILSKITNIREEKLINKTKRRKKSGRK